MSSQSLAERICPEEAIQMLQEQVNDLRRQAQQWKAWALEMEREMLRSGWTEEDILATQGNVKRPE